MNLAKFSLEHKNVVYTAAVLLALYGILSALNMGWLEDPDISVKSAVVIIDYPGATPEQVEQQVVEVVETKLQEMAQIKHLSSLSRDSRAIIRIDIRDEYWTPELPQVWDELRRKIRDIESILPAGVGTPVIGDDYGLVFGFVFSLQGEGFDAHDLHQYARDIRRELSNMPELSRVDFWGVRERQLVIDILPSRFAEFGIVETAMSRLLLDQNLVIDAGDLKVGDKRYAVNIGGELQSLDDLGELVIFANNDQGRIEQVRLKDVAKLSYGYSPAPAQIFRKNGAPSLALAIAPIQGSNIVSVGNKLDQRLEQIQQTLPVGLQMSKVAWQSDYVSSAVSGFLGSLMLAVLIVFAVLAVTMGLRMGLLIGGVGLGLTVLGSFAIMPALGLDLHRISLGALIVAMGMMVDNAIVVADGFVSRVKQGMSRVEAAIESADQPAMPLLGATVVAVMAFYPVFGSDASAAEYSRALFMVVGLSLVLSWIISQTLIPLLCVQMIPANQQATQQSRSLALFRKLVVWALQKRLLTLLALIVLLIVSILSLPLVKQEFFPTAKRDQFMVDVWMPEGTRSLAVEQQLVGLEQLLLGNSKVKAVASFIGQGSPRFYLPINPELPNPSFAQLLVTTVDDRDVDDVIAEFETAVKQTASNATMQVRKFGVGASPKWPIEIRLVGPSHADAKTLRQLAGQVEAVLLEHPDVSEVSNNWRQRNLRVKVDYKLQEGARTGIGRSDVGNALQASLNGRTVGLLREGDQTYPIVAYNRFDNSNDVRLNEVQVKASGASEGVPLQQLSKDNRWEWYDPIIYRWDRRRAITVQASSLSDPTGVVSSLKDSLEAIELPEGYNIELAGEYQNNIDTQRTLSEGVPLAIMVMLLVVIGLFNAFRPLVLVFAIIPFAFIGVVFGHILTGVALGFVSLLGIFSLSGMMIKNAVVLLDEINLNQERGQKPYDAVVHAAESRLMPVFNASLTTILGLVPLLWDVFWQSMSVSIMFGLIAGSLVTMILVPVLYAMLYRVDVPAKK